MTEYNKRSKRIRFNVDWYCLPNRQINQFQVQMFWAELFHTN